MKKTYKFSKLFLPAVVISALIIGSGVFGLFTKGLNLGLDFKAGFIANVKLVPTAMDIKYVGPKTFAFSQDSNGLYLVSTSIDGDNEEFSFLFSEYKTLGEFKKAASQIEGVSVQTFASDDVLLSNVFTNSQELAKLSDKSFILYYTDEQLPVISADQVRQALATIEGIAVQMVGEPNERLFQLRLADDGNTENASAHLYDVLTQGLISAYGEGNFVYLSTDFTGSQFSSSLVNQSIVLVIFAMGIIFLYVMFRFKWDFALAGIVALIHDVFIMIAFLVWTQLEFSTLTVAALLTIIGYSINDTVVLFDRVRENSRLFPTLVAKDIFNKSLSDVLGRTIITSLTTLVAVLALYLFNDGGIKYFALAVLVGIVSGTYSTLFISTSILSLTCKDKKGSKIIKSKIPGQTANGAIV